MRLIDADELQIVSIDDPTEWDKDNKFFYVPKQYVEDAPTIDAKPVRHGQWIYTKNHNTCSCSKCGHVELIDWAIHEAKFCPNCGAYMWKHREDEITNETD